MQYGAFYMIYKKLPIILTVFTIIAAVALSVVNESVVWVFVGIGAALLVWFLTSVIISPTVLRTDAVLEIQTVTQPKTSNTSFNNATSIRENAFCGDTSLKNVTIPNDVASIGRGAFSGCTGLMSLIIPNSVTLIGENAFANCSGLTSITYKGTKEQWNKISKGNNWNYGTGNYTVHCTDGTIQK